LKNIVPDNEVKVTGIHLGLRGAIDLEHEDIKRCGLVGVEIRFPSYSARIGCSESVLCVVKILEL
jgi:hypothetical protein